jgi:hypothetical protein
MYYPFEEVFREQVSPGLLKLLETDGFVKLRDIGIEVGTTKSLAELCMETFICDAMFYCFFLDQELLLGPKEQCTKEALAYGWKKHQNYIIAYPVYNDFLLSITYLYILCYLLSNICLSHIFVIQNFQLSVTVEVNMGAPCFSFVWVCV